jgi:hypothetical protein
LEDNACPVSQGLKLQGELLGSRGELLHGEPGGLEVRVGGVDRGLVELGQGVADAVEGQQRGPGAGGGEQEVGAQGGDGRDGLGCHRDQRRAEAEDGVAEEPDPAGVPVDRLRAGVDPHPRRLDLLSEPAQLALDPLALDGELARRGGDLVEPSRRAGQLPVEGAQIALRQRRESLVGLGAGQPHLRDVAGDVCV